jgi:hypothetical protein
MDQHWTPAVDVAPSGLNLSFPRLPGAYAPGYMMSPLRDSICRSLVYQGLTPLATRCRPFGAIHDFAPIGLSGRHQFGSAAASAARKTRSRLPPRMAWISRSL